jgi:glycosyltransferase involved in cell wall biosynthesis
VIANTPSQQKSCIAIVVQRYGTEIVGGAESHARIMAGKLSKELGYEVEIYTTTAKDYMTWANHYPPGEEAVEGILVRRFNVKHQRAKLFGLFDRIIRRLLRYSNRFGFLGGLSRLLEWVWIYVQGPVCPDLVKALRQNRQKYKKILFYCYLYYPTVVGSLGLEEQAILLPLGHDEPPFHFNIIKDLLRRIPRLIPMTEPEWEMIKSKLDPQNLPLATPSGLGFDEVDHSQSAPVSSPVAAVLQGSPFLLYLGRISAGKGVHELINWYSHWKRMNPDVKLRLVLAGQKEDSVQIPEDLDFEYLGYVSDDERNVLIKQCSVLANPSVYESLSMIVIEAMIARKPVLARRQCAVFRFYAENAPAVKLFGGADEFNVELSRLLMLPNEAKQRDLEVTYQWASDRFSWSRILENFRKQIDS